MLIGLARVCRRGSGGLAWLLDYSLAVVLSAWDGVAAPRARGRDGSWNTDPLVTPIAHAHAPPDPPRVFQRRGRVAASLALIGVLSISVLGALWSQDAPAEAPGPAEAGVVIAQTTPREPVVLWAPLIESDGSSEPGLPSAEPGLLAATVEVQATVVAEPATPDANVEAAAAETPTPDPQPPAPATPSPPEAEPEPVTVVVPPSGQMSQVTLGAAALAAGWPESEIEELLSVAWCESRFRVEANGWGALGLMQIMPEWFASLGIDVALAFDPATNLRVARHIYLNDLKNGYGEWASWTCKPAGLPESAP